MRSLLATVPRDEHPMAQPSTVAWLHERPPCPGPDLAHVPKQKPACAGGRTYFLFSACEAGCLPCVQHLVLEEGIDPCSISTGCKYSALSFAEFSHKQYGTEGCLDVAAWLRERISATTSALTDGTVEGDSGANSATHDKGVTSVEKAGRTGKGNKIVTEIAPATLSNRQIGKKARRRLEESLQVPVDAPIARAMMESMGWVEGQSLGSSSSEGLLQPLVPNIGRDVSSKKGLGADTDY